MISDEAPPGAYDTGGSAFDAIRNADNPVSVAAPAPPSAVPQEAWDRAVGAWINAHVRSSPITQGASGAWEHLHNVLPKLKELLERELKS